MHKDITSKNKPNDAVFLATQQQGGEIQARGMSSLHHNRQQIANYQRSEPRHEHNKV